MKVIKRTEISRAAIGRIPVYLKFLKSTEHSCENISATAIARALGLGDVQVRKDLASISGAGRPKTGYRVDELITTLEKFLQHDDNKKVVLVGVGKLGKALLDYKGFSEYGLEISAAFDIAVKKKYQSKAGKPVYPMDAFAEYCKENNCAIAIIAVPADNAQSVCDTVVGAGIKGIWCFAPCRLNVPDGIAVQYENMALSLAFLSNNI